MLPRRRVAADILYINTSDAVIQQGTVISAERERYHYAGLQSGDANPDFRREAVNCVVGVRSYNKFKWDCPFLPSSGALIAYDKSPRLRRLQQETWCTTSSDEDVGRYLEILCPGMLRASGMSLTVEQRHHHVFWASLYAEGCTSMGATASVPAMKDCKDHILQGVVDPLPY